MTIHDAVFDCCSVLLDDRVYMNCDFDQCTLIYTEGFTPELVDCTLTNCDWACMSSHTGEHLNTVNPLNPEDDDEWE